MTRAARFVSVVTAGCVAWALLACGGDEGGVADNGTGGSSVGGTSGVTGGGGAGGSVGGSGGFGATSSGGGSGGTTSGGGSAGQGATGGGGVGGAAGGGSSDLCNAPPGNLFAHGTFEEGMDGLAPTGWEVRNPAKPGECGTPSDHVFLTDPAPGCTGNALAVDAKGQWDCYAVQRVSDYDSIQGGATYRITASVRSVGNSVNAGAWFSLGAQWLDANDAFFGDEKNPKPANVADFDFEWKVLSFELVAPADAKRILLWLSAHYPGRVDFDNLSVVKL